MPLLNFTFFSKIPGTLNGGNFGQSITRINGTTQFNGISLVNLVAIGDTNSFGSVGAYVAPTANQTQAGNWVEQINLAGSDQTLGDALAASDLSGNYLLISAFNHNSSAGVCWVFKSSNTSRWFQQQELVGSDTVAGDLFVGRSIYGNTLVCASTGQNGARGKAYVFNQVAGVWTQVQTIVPADIAPGDRFGQNGVLLGTELFLSTILQGGGLGAVYYYTLVAGVWTQTQKLTGIVAGQNFGGAIAYDGTTLVIGAAGSGTGNAYVYTKNSAGQFVLQETLVGSDSSNGDDFGFAVAVQGTVIAVGAVNNLVNGAVYIFNNTTGTYVQTEKITQTDATGSDKFGCQVQLYSGLTSWLIVGAYNNGAANIGAAYFYIAPDPATPVITKAGLIFQGVRRNPGKNLGQASYRYKPRYYEYVLQNVFQTLGIVNNQFTPVTILNQIVQDYDFELYEFRFAYASPNGPVSLTVPYSALTVYDVNKKQISNLPVLDVYLNGAENSKYQNGGLVPPLVYPVNSEIRIELTNLITDPTLLPLTMVLHLTGHQRIPC